MLVLRIVALLGAAGAAAVAPSTVEVNSTASLEAIVAIMAEGQSKGNVAPTPQRTIFSEDVVFLEQTQHRQLGRCVCGEYRNGAAIGSPVCAKLEGGKSVCYPQMHSGSCSDLEATPCGSTGGGSVAASPAPTFLDAEMVEKDVYLNVNLQLLNTKTIAPSQLPNINEFALALAHLTSTPLSRINVLTTWGTPAGVRVTGVVKAPLESAREGGTSSGSGMTATVRATFAAKTIERREALETLLQFAEELPAIAGVSYRIVHLEVSEQIDYPIICEGKAEGAKAKASELLRQQVVLKTAEAELLRQGVLQSAGGAVCDDEQLQRIAHTLGVDNR